MMTRSKFSAFPPSDRASGPRRRWRRGWQGALIAAFMVPVAGGDEGQRSPQGIWLNEKETVAVRMARCGDAGPLCGRIVWLKKPYRKDGSLKRDDGRPFCGLQVVRDMARKGENRWSGGTIYDPDEGTSYRGRLRLDGADRLKVRGYILVPVLGRTMVWQRIPRSPGPCPDGD